MAALTGSRALSHRDLVISVHVSVSIKLAKSLSSCMHSTLTGSFTWLLYPLSCCLTLSTATLRR